MKRVHSAAAAALAVMEGAGLLAAHLGWPTGSFHVGVIAAITGFPITVLPAWTHGRRGRQQVGVKRSSTL